jgi:putative membrane protein
MGDRRPWTYELLLLAGVVAVLAWSGAAPKDRFTWFMEVFPVLIAVPALVATHRRFRFTPLAYTLIAIHCCILMIGGKYTYAQVPLGFWMERTFGFARNHYDRIGHFAQGFVPAIVAREILWRRSPLRGSRWLPFLVFCFCLAFSAFYEFIEWWTALATGGAADAFLGTQGDPWDTQWDMFFASIGALTALATLSRVHTAQLERMTRGVHGAGLAAGMGAGTEVVDRGLPARGAMH